MDNFLFDDSTSTESNLTPNWQSSENPSPVVSDTEGQSMGRTRPSTFMNSAVQRPTRGVDPQRIIMRVRIGCVNGFSGIDTHHHHGIFDDGDGNAFGSSSSTRPHPSHISPNGTSGRAHNNHPNSSPNGTSGSDDNDRPWIYPLISTGVATVIRVFLAGVGCG